MVSDERDRPGVMVDPRAPRFGQALTAGLLFLGIGLQLPHLVYIVAVILGVAVLTGWRFDIYGLIWRHGVLRVIEPPAQFESAAPHRFAKLMGAGGSILASTFLVLGYPLVGFAIAFAIAVLAGLAASTGICIGCRLYRQVSFFRRYNLV